MTARKKDPLGNFHRPWPIASWANIWQAYERFSKPKNPNPQWIFRAQANPIWTLSTPLERAITASGRSLQENMTGSEEGARNIEDGLLRIFQRHSHLYVTNPPRDDNTLEWFALMQHHGA